MLENCNCSYHSHQCEEEAKYSGPVDVDLIQEEICKGNIFVVPGLRDGYNESSSASYYENRSSAAALREPGAVQFPTNEDSYEVIMSNRTALESEPGFVVQDSTTSSSFLFEDNVTDMKNFPLSGACWTEKEGFVFDETEISRGLVGYQEGFEPEVITVHRWELVGDQEGEEKSPPSQSSKEERRSRASHSRASHTSRLSREEPPPYNPANIPASAAEV